MSTCTTQTLASPESEIHALAVAAIHDALEKVQLGASSNLDVAKAIAAAAAAAGAAAVPAHFKTAIGAAVAAGAEGAAKSVNEGIAAHLPEVMNTVKPAIAAVVTDVAGGLLASGLAPIEARLAQLEAAASVFVTSNPVLTAIVALLGKILPHEVGPLNALLAEAAAKPVPATPAAPPATKA